MLFCRIVDHDVEPAEMPDGAFNESAAEAGIAQVAGDQHAFRTRAFHQLFGTLGIFIFIEILDHHIGPFQRIGDGDGPADAAIPTGDQCDLAKQFLAWHVIGFYIFRLREHPAFMTRLRGLMLRGLFLHDRTLCYCTLFHDGLLNEVAG
jgi:hypothetical protein